MSEDIIATVQKLIAQSSSPYEEEARTAAKMACDLIRRHSLVVVSHAAAPRATTSAPPDGGGPIRLKSKYAGRCKVCDGTYKIGDWVHWQRGYGAMCARCYKAGERFE